MKNMSMCLNIVMNIPIKKKFSTSNPGVNSKEADHSKPSWHFEVEGSGQRKRYLRSIKDNASV